MSKAKWLKTPFGIRLPAELRVGARTYTVRNHTFDDEAQFGECRPGRCELRLEIDKHVSWPDLHVDFWHEAVHMIEAESRIEGLSDSDVDRLANGIAQVVVQLMSVQ